MKIVEPKTERVGGKASLLSALVCLGFGIWDHQEHHRIWAYWMVFSVLLFINGLLMFRHAHKLETDQSPEPKHAAA